jgi:hypothetical protein
VPRRLVPLLAMLAMLTLPACEYDREKPIFMAPGSYGDIAVVVSSAALAGALGTFQTAFNQSFTFVLVEEDLFKLDVYEPDRWDLCKGYKNIIFVWRVGDGGPVEKFLRNQLTEEGEARAAVASGVLLQIEEPFASYQHALVAAGTDRNSLISFMRNHAVEMREVFETTSARRIMRRYRHTGLNAEAMDQVWLRHRFFLELPAEFVLNQDSPDGFGGVEFMQTGPSRGLTIAWTQSVDPQFLLGRRDLLLQWRQEIASKLHQDEIVPESLVWKEDEIAGLPAVRLEGAWNSQRFDGGGPFWAWFVADPEGQRVFCLDALCYAPGVDKMDYFRRMQAILQTFSLQRPRA